MSDEHGIAQEDYDAVMKAIGISVDGFKRHINKARNLARQLVEGSKNRQAADALLNRLALMERALDVPDLTKHRMAKRENARRSQQAVLEAKLAEANAEIERLTGRGMGSAA